MSKKITIVGMGLIGGSLYKAAIQAGYDAMGIDKDDAVNLAETDILLLALPQEAIAKWVADYAKTLKRGAVIVDTCGVKEAVCSELRPLIPDGCTFVGGHPMAGKEHSGYAYSDASILKGAPMILTPYPDTPADVIERLVQFFGKLGFGRVLTTTPEHHDRMIAYTSQLSHVIAAAYTQEPLSHDAAGYSAGSYANMTRIASMDPVVWERLFSADRENLLEVLDGFIGRLKSFREALVNKDTDGMRRFIQAGAASKASDGVRRGAKMEQGRAAFGQHLRLTVFGASHAPSIGMRLENFPRGFMVDMDALKEFMERRAPGRDKMSTARREPDLPRFLSGIADGRTTGERIEAVIFNTDVRKKDYGEENTVPRPGHADYPQWVKTGRIESGGGANSGRMTAPMCIAGGICLQWLAMRNVTVEGRLFSVGGKSDGFEEEILKAKAEGDSVGGVIEVCVNGLPAGLGGAMFDGVESELSAALFGIPGVKGVEFGAGFRAAAMRGSEHNDPFATEDGKVVTIGNNHGGLLGGMTTGMPLLLRLAMKPTPSIFMEQRSVDLAMGEETVKNIQGRHDPCIARRAIPVAEALTAFVIADIMLAAESETPRICLTLTDGTLTDALASLNASRPFVDIVELRVDCLAESELPAVSSFPKQCGLPVILTIRRSCDGGHWNQCEGTRKALFTKLLKESETPFAFVDFEDDFRHSELEALALSRGTRIIRSLHDFDGPVKDVVARCQTMKGSSDDIPKIAFKANHCSDLTRLFNETTDFTGFPHILCAMGSLGLASRILAVRTHSMLTFASPKSTVGAMRDIGHLTPETLVRTYRFRSLTTATPLYAVTGWPLGHTASPELNNSAFAADANPSVMVPIAAETAGEAIECADALGVKGIAVTIPHKGEIMKHMASIDETALAIGAVNTAVKTAAGWKGFNTDADGFTAALLEFLQVDGISGRKVALLGAGGAARAVAFALHRLGADVCIFNHTYEKAVALAALYGFQSAPLDATSCGKLAEYADIIVQATSVGLNATTADADPILFYEFKGTESIYDLVYAPSVTPIMARAASAGCRTCNGMSMLIEQARVQRRHYAEEQI